VSACVLLADDDASLRFVLSQALGKEGFRVRATGAIATLAKWVSEGEGDVVLSDVYMGDGSIFDALPAMRAARPELPFIVMSAQSTVSTALSAAQFGAFDYAPKPFDLEALIAQVRAAAMRKPEAKARAAAKISARDEHLPLIGKSAAMQVVYRILARAAPTDLPVLIVGESGTGKARLARAIHDNSKRARAPFVIASVASLAPAELEADIFAPGGKLAQARNGTLLIEDLDACPAESQVRLAARLPRADEDAERPQVRLIATSQRNLAGMARTGEFRLDLLNVLNVMTVRLPPLRERLEDAPDLARAFLRQAQRAGLAEKVLSPEAAQRLQRHDYPGNVRELENLMRRASALNAGMTIAAADLDALIERSTPLPRSQAEQAPFDAAVAEAFAAARPGLPEAGLYDRLLAELEAPLIRRTLESTGGNQIRAAAILGINRNTLRKKMQALGIASGAGD
jgi:two-component system nitrogen regulation response regulator GlnG